MANPNYRPVQAFSPLDERGATMYRSPVSYAEPFPVYDDHGDVGTRGIEMNEHMRPFAPRHQESQKTMYSTTSSLFPGPNPSTTETQSFLHDPINKIDTFYASNSYHPYRDNTGRQLRHLLIGSSSRWLITAALCGGYILATRIWQEKQAQSEAEKKMYNTITTGTSIALGLNIASAFKDLALNMRWVILSRRKRNLVEADLLLKADSMQKLAKLVFVTRRPAVIIGAVLWLLINVLAQAGIAMLSLTYGFDVDTVAVKYHFGNVSIPEMKHFSPQGIGFKANPSWQDESYTAHTYGESAYNWGVNESMYKPKAGDLYQPNGAMVWLNDTAEMAEFIFSDSPVGQQLGASSVYTARTISSTYTCESHKVLAGGDGTTVDLRVDGIGNLTVYQTVPNTTTFFVAQDSSCANNTRCQVVQAFEASDTDPWYYKCNVTLGKTRFDPMNVSYISDYMAQIAVSAIAQTGFVDSEGETGVTYPLDSAWGTSLKGNASEMGMTMAAFALGSIAGASMYNNFTSYEGSAPTQGVYLHLGHPYFFYLIIGLICGCHLFFLIVVAIMANRVMVGPEGTLSMALLLRPIADALDGVSGGKENKAFRDAKRNTMVIYEKGRNGRWALNMS